MIRRGVVVAALTLLLGACSPTATGTPPLGTGEAPGTTATANPSSTPSVAIADLRFTCNTFAFGADILTAPPSQDQDASTAVGAAVRDEIAGSGGTLPARGWRLVGQDAGHADFVALGGDARLVFISLVNANGAWTLDAAGECNAEVVVAPGVRPAAWAWGSPGLPGPATRTFDALVTEQACASGRKADGRIIGPIVVPTPDMVLVFFGVHPLPGAQDCQSNPSTRVPVDLGEPLGNRKLLDGSQLPFRDPTNSGP